MKRIIIFLILLLCGSMISSISSIYAADITAVSSDPEDTKPLEAPKYIPDASKGPTAHQKKIIKVEGVRDSNPGVYWYQIDDGRFRAQSYRASGGYVYTNNIGTNSDPWPAVAEVVDKIEMKSSPIYKPHEYKDWQGKGHHPDKISNEIITKVETIKGRQDTESEITDLQITDLKTAVMITSKTGKQSRGSNKFVEFKREDSGNKAWSDACGCYLNWTKYNFGYYTPINIYWRGDVVEQKKIELTGKTTLKIGEETNLKAVIATIAPGESSYGSPVDVSTRADQTTWKTDNSSIVSLVGKSGKIKGNKKGSAKITAVWKDDGDRGYELTATLVVTVDDDAPPPPPPPPTGGCSAPSPGTALEGRYMDPVVTAKILADARGNEQFDVLQGIPTSETLYGNVFARNYLYQNKFVQMSGTCTFNIPVTQVYDLRWTETEDGPPDKNGNPTTVTVQKQRTESVTKEYVVERPYSYWVIDGLEVYKIDQATLINYALPNGSITIQPNGYNPPSYAASTAGEHYFPPPVSAVTLPTKTVNSDTVPDEDFTAEAERSVGKVKVKNDYLIFNGQTIMDNSQVEESGPTPKQIPAPVQIGQNVLYSPNNLIAPTLANKKDTISKGTIEYNLMPGNIKIGSPKQEFQIHGINTVTVHTPVVDYAVLPDSNRPFDQRMKPDMSRVVLVLDRPFTINFTERGQHLSIPGYGNRDYRKYTLMKRVMFPFDTYNEDKSEFYPKNTWVNIPVGQDSKTFKMPTWVNEGNYHIRTEAWAINSQGQAGCQQNYNGDLNNYCATEGFDVGVVGRLFGFQIWDIGDLRYEKVFRTAKGSTSHTPAAYFSGGRDENGVPTNIYGQNSWILPIRAGSHPTEKATVPRNGYSFLFDFKTIGNLWNKGEGIRIDPTFWYVSNKGGTPVQVDLYYDTSGSANKMIKVGSTTDVKTYSRVYQLADKMRNINSTELQRAAQYEYDHILSPAQRASLPFNKFMNQYLSRKTTIGAGYGIEILPYQSRTLIGPTSIPSGVNPTEALRSVQHWYGEYNLPIAPYILPKGTDIVALANKYGGKLTGREPEFLKKGYIVVNFEIYTVKNNDQNTRVLGYNAPLANMWAIEGQVMNSTDYLGNRFNYRFGDIIKFESDFSVRNDFRGQGS